MKKAIIIIVSCFLFGSGSSLAQPVKLDTKSLEAVKVSISTGTHLGKGTICVIKDSAIKEVDQPTFGKLKGIDFHNGNIEVKVLSRLLKDAPELARGFIGIAFRINGSNSTFECIYLRPTNARAEDQVRRNHSIQYFSYPEYSYERFRKEAPEKYESYTDMELNKWIKLRIEVRDTKARLFVNDNRQPSLIVQDLKHGANATGAIGLWVDVGTMGYFKDLIIHKL